MPTRKVQIIDDDGTILSEREEPLPVVEGQFIEAINAERAMKAVTKLETAFENWSSLGAPEQAKAMKVMMAALSAVIRNQMHMLDKSSPSMEGL